MKNIKRIIALLLCLTLMTGLFGCGSTPQETLPPVTEPAPTEPPAEDLYAAAKASLESADKITLDVMTTTTTSVADQEFVIINKDILSYNGYGTDTCQISLKRSITYLHDPSIAIEDASIPYSEIYSDGTVYFSSQDYGYLFSAELSAEEAAVRYVPAALLDASLYGSLSADDSGKITFSSPTCSEIWAMPADAEMLEASGTAELDANGALKEMSYTVSYRYGSATITKQVESKPRSEALSVVVPQDADKYLALQDPNALETYTNSLVMMWQLDSATSSGMENLFTAAGMVMRNESFQMEYFDDDGEISFKADTNISQTMYSTGESDTYKQEETYLDGKYVSVVNDGVPTTQTGIESEVIANYTQEQLAFNMVSPEFWLDVTTSDLGSLYLMEFSCSDDFGNNIQNSICSTFWNDPAFLNKLASAYVNDNISAYMAFDKFTGLPTAAGYSFAGTHTIDGKDYAMTAQIDQSIHIPSAEAYYNITDEFLPEEEPQQKATPLFYHVTGEEGQEMWLFGTIHVGDARTAYLPQEIYDAFTASDALALEFDSKAFEQQMEEDAALQAQVAACYYYTDGTTTSDHIGEELYTQALKYLKATGNHNANIAAMKPSILESSISNFYLAQGCQLTSMQGCESRLEQLAKQQEKEIRDVESGLFQMQMLTNWSDELQILLLEDTLESNALEYWTETYELYEAWCAGDEAELRKMISDEVDTSEMTEEELAEYEAQKPYIEEYNKSMSYDRNDGMLEVAKQYLESGDTVFFAVGLAHLLNNVNGLVDALRAAGYTVEPVQYVK